MCYRCWLRQVGGTGDASETVVTAVSPLASAREGCNYQSEARTPNRAFKFISPPACGPIAVLNVLVIQRPTSKSITASVNYAENHRGRIGKLILLDCIVAIEFIDGEGNSMVNSWHILWFIAEGEHSEVAMGEHKERGTETPSVTVSQ
ncbi:hypothetical protein DFP72DRAFT_1042549 [Ephemerocybe angulata]|uniref:Uncharacterized protein n=1 Tax=Ephemerocybe angulata TaxID=980116 RepID=A0A8H6M9Z8_9AGAR|nr:hypothetical protein DFP72DRAFT_1042549 [Tulosesus angulatus]